jgi:cytochrome c oxidase cbb3-type subunit 3
MNALQIKALGFAAVLIIATIAVVLTMDIDLSDPINAIAMGGAIAIATITAYVTTKYIGQMKTDTATGELVDENWDGIGEYSNELPSGWAYSFLGTLIWLIWYWTMGYPVNQFSQIGQYNEEVLAKKAAYEKKFKNISNDQLVEMGKSLFFVQCAPCHGDTADGLSGRAHDLTSRISKKEILYTIKNGSNQLGYPMGMMPPGMATGKDAEDIATYIAGGLKGEKPAAIAACASCHGADLKGNGGMAPNLVEYDEPLISHVLEHGKKGVIGKMPSFKTLVTPVQEKALTAYLQSIQ